MGKDEIYHGLDESQQNMTPEIDQTIGTPISDIVEDVPFLQATAIIPVDVPSRPMDKIKLYVNGAVRRLYIYDSTNNTWRFSVLT